MKIGRTRIGFPRQYASMKISGRAGLAPGVGFGADMAHIDMAHTVAARRVADTREHLQRRDLLDGRQRLVRIHRVAELVLAHRRTEVEVAKSRQHADRLSDVGAQLLEPVHQRAVGADGARVGGGELLEREVLGAHAVVLGACAQRLLGQWSDKPVLQERLDRRVAEVTALEVLDRLRRLPSARPVDRDREADLLEQRLHLLGGQRRLRRDVSRHRRRPGCPQATPRGSSRCPARRRGRRARRHRGTCRDRRTDVRAHGSCRSPVAWAGGRPRTRRPRPRRLRRAPERGCRARA